MNIVYANGRSGSHALRPNGLSLQQGRVTQYEIELSRQRVAVSSLGCRSSPRLAAKRVSFGEVSPSLKRRREDTEPQPGGVVDLEDASAEDAENRSRKGKVKIEPGTEGANVEEKKGPTPPAKLLEFWEKLIKEYPHKEYGEYKLICDENGTWMVFCELCKDKKPKGYDTGHRYSLSNFKKQHFVSKLHQSKLDDWKEGTSKAERKLEELKARREALVTVYNDRGARMVDSDTWRCEVCNFRGTFVDSRDTIKAHINGRDHARMVAKREAAGPSSTQPTLAASFANGVARGLAKYPNNYVPSVADVADSEKMRLFLEKKRCIGWFEETVCIEGVEHAVEPLLHDLDDGKLWYADPYFNRSSSMAEYKSHKGTFRHKECQGFDCANCRTIPSLPDFKSRLTRETTAETKRGARICKKGVRLEYLQKQELIDSLKVWQKRCKTLELDRYWLNVHVLNLSKSKEDLSARLKRALASGSLPEIAEFFRRASESGAFEGRSTLLNFLLDLGKNLLTVHEHDGKGTGKRHSRSSKLMYECLQQFGGPLVANFLNVNLLGPAINTCKSLYRKDALLYVGLLQESTFEHLAGLLKQLMAKKGIIGKVPLEVSEDETACIASATWNCRTDCIDGFCGPKAVDGSPHVCTFDCNPSAASYESIVGAFDTYATGTMCFVVALNVLCADLPTLVLAILPTCNTFTHVSIQQRWDQVRSFLVTHFAEIGVLVSHASDGDRRRVKCMLQSIARGTYGLECPGFIMKAEVVNGYPVMMDQDPFHIGKKLRNPLLVASRNVYWGTHLATINHLRLVMSVFPKSEHGLLEEDVDVRDKQSVAAVQRAASLRVLSCLEKLQAGFTLPDGRRVQEDVTGTMLHLEVIHSFLQVFYGVDSLYQRVVLASFVANIVYMGSEFIRHRGFGHTLKKNWLTREGQTDLLISCHFAVNLIRVMRDRFSHLDVCLEKASSDCVESIFSLMGQWVRNKHNFTFGEALERISHVARLEQIKVDEDSPLFVTSRRRKLFWLEVNGTLSMRANMKDYESVPDEKLVEAWAAGLAMARDRALTAGMVPVLQAARKWTDPWPASLSESESLADELITDEELDPEAANTVASSSGRGATSAAAQPAVPERGRGATSAAAQPAVPERGGGATSAAVQPAVSERGGGATSAAAQPAIPERGRGATSAAVQISLQPSLATPLPIDAGMSSCTELDLASEEAVVIRSSILDAFQEIGDASTDGTDSSVREKTSTTVEVPGKGLVYKARLISELNAAPEHLSLDRLRRVQASTQRAGSSVEAVTDSDAEGKEVGLFDDVAIELLSSDDKTAWFLARVQKMFKVTSGGARIDYHRPVSIAEATREAGVEVILKYYKAVDATRLAYQYGGYEDEGEADPMPLTAILCTIKLSPLTDQGHYELEPGDLAVLDAFVRQDVDQTRPDMPQSVRQIWREQNSVAVAGENNGVETTQHVTRGGRRATRVVLR
ncbi:hypothetical protein KFL_000070500 [Klebsormidium nitens]|uniref:Uncharacterized protein n=1 Tax=Klebsormidium nitens TaxID=105231 RepID=A0A1Y1HKD8_KLENI|nr:hypothetical protein KFL_000070500 [Klebsormidium nitens]|eukprot:GAQ78082.1 hypothetical protein KFL_000070500 [Klebsormidium nitens]